VYHMLPICHVYDEVRKQSSASECQCSCIRVSVWCVNSYVKELFVLKVTFTLIFLNSFVTCLTYGFTCESCIFLYRDACQIL